MATQFQYGNGTNSTFGANTITHFYDRAGIRAANVSNVYQQFADSQQMPKKHGKEFKISRFQHMFDRDLESSEFAKKGYLSSRSLAEITAAVNAASLPEGAGKQNLVSSKKVTISTSIKRYGQMIEYTDDVELFSEDSVQIRLREELGKLANEQHENLIQLDMLGTNNVMYSGLATSVATMGTGLVADGSLDDEYRINYDFIKRCVAKLVRNRAEMNTEIVKGSVKVGTQPIDRAYFAIVGPQVSYDLENVTWGNGKVEERAFVPAYKYAAADKLADGEVGAIGRVRFIESEKAAVYAGEGMEVPAGYTGTLSYTGEIGTDAKFDVFPILMPSKESFATVGLKGAGKIIFHAMSPNELDRSNPYANQGFSSYNFWYGGLILQEEKLLKGYVLATGL